MLSLVPGLKRLNADTLYLGKPRCNHMQAGIARPPAKGKSDAGLSGFCLDSLVSWCPGPGNSWGNLAAPPASKEAVSPSINILYCEHFLGSKTTFQVQD